MPRTALAVQKIKRTTLVPAFVAGDSANGHSFPNDGTSYIEVVTGGTASNVTVLAVAAGPDGLAVTNRVVACAATARNKIGPFPPGIYNQADGSVYVDLSSAVALTIGVFTVSG